MHLGDFQEDIRKQFISAGIFNSPTKKFQIYDLVDLEKNIPTSDLEIFKKILKFKVSRIEDSSEYAISWLLGGKHIGKSQRKTDILLPSKEGLSVKATTNLSTKKKIKFGRIGSCESFKQLMSLWSFYVNYLSTEKSLGPTRISKKQIDNINFRTPHSIKTFLEFSSRTLPTFYAREDQVIIEKFLDKILLQTDSISENIIDHINKSFEESLQKEVNHLIVIDKSNLRVKLLDQINSASFIENFFSNYFESISGNELWIRIRE